MEFGVFMLRRWKKSPEVYEAVIENVLGSDEKRINVCTLQTVQTFLTRLICHVICENLPYVGTNSVNLDQLYSRVCDSIYG